MSENTNLVLIGGKSGSGKTVSLRNIPKPKGVMYLNCESNKRLPFKSDFEQYTITDPKSIYTAFTYAESDKGKHIHTIVVDTLDFMMEMFETVHVLKSKDTQKAWGQYGAFFRELMSQYVAKSTKNVIFLAHTFDKLNETEMVMETFVKVKGSLMSQGIEAFFSTVLSCKKVATSALEHCDSPLLNISDKEKVLEYKHVFQTILTKDTVGERLRSSIGMWDDKETYIDNDVQLVIDRLHQYYN